MKIFNIKAKIFFTFLFLSLFLPPIVKGVDMESSLYQIKYGNVNIGALHPTSANYSLSTTIGQTAAQEFSSSGYIVKAGFQYWHSIVPFTFSISDNTINLGSLLPDTPSTATTNLSVSFGAAGNYQVTAVEEGPLQTMGGEVIDDTSCDSGSCDETTAAAWTSNSTYGFGYKMSGEDVPATFTTCGANCYRRFANSQALPTAETPVVVMSSNNVTVDLTSKPKDIIHQSTVTFKANVSGNQAAGSYQTVINFVAIPTY